MKIEYNQEKHCITFGELEYRRIFFYSPDQFIENSISRMGKYNDLQNKISKYCNKEKMSYTQAKRKAAGDIFGCSALQLSKHLIALQYKVFYHPIKDAISAIPAISMKHKEPFIRLANEHRGIIEQLRKDNLTHLAPICIVMGKDPQGCKEQLGKGLWKQLTKQSKSRIGKIATVVHRFQHNKDIGHWVQLCINTPSALMTIDNMRWIEESPNLIQSLKKFTRITKSKEVNDYVHYHRDTLMMQKELNEHHSILNMNKEKLVKYHDEISARISKLRNPDYDKEIPNYSDIVEKLKDIDTLGYELKLLRTGHEIVLEGEKQSHCIGLYAKQAYSGKVLLFSLRKGGEIYSSFMLSQDYYSDNQWYNVQHYKKFNQQVDCNDAKMVVEYVVSRLNEVKK